LALAAACAGRPPAGTVAPTPAFPLEEATIAQLQAGLQSGTYTSAGLTEAYLARIAALDRQGPNLRSIIAINPDARAIATQLDAERRSGRVRGPLHGIPVIIKDNIETADAMATTAGSLT
jgi:amidase